MTRRLFYYANKFLTLLRTQKKKKKRTTNLQAKAINTQKTQHTFFFFYFSSHNMRCESIQIIARAPAVAQGALRHCGTTALHPALLLPPRRHQRQGSNDLPTKTAERIHSGLDLPALPIFELSRKVLLRMWARTTRRWRGDLRRRIEGEWGDSSSNAVYHRSSRTSPRIGHVATTGPTETSEGRMEASRGWQLRQ